MIVDLSKNYYFDRKGNLDGESALLSAGGFLGQAVINFRNGESDMGCAHRIVRVALAVPALVACSVLALAETVLRLAVGILAGVVGLVACCNADILLFAGIAVLTSLLSFDASLRCIGSIFANVFTSCSEDHKMRFENVQFPCAFELPIPQG